MIIKNLKEKFGKELSVLYPIEEIQSFFHLLGDHFLGYSRFEMAMKGQEEISETALEKWLDALTRLKEAEPLQYIIGETEFYGLTFKVNSHTLIPRPETEELVSWVLEEVNTVGEKILDVGTGSGCIAISLAKKLPMAQVVAIDISEEALKISKENAVSNAVDVVFFQKDILSMISLGATYTTIVSNPPYVRALEKKWMHNNVLNYEPQGALFVADSDPLVFYRVIANLAIKRLEFGGGLYFEINEYLRDEMIQLLLAIGFEDIEVRKDIFGKDRMLRCKKPAL